VEKKVKNHCPNVCLVIVSNKRSSLRFVETNILRKLSRTSPFNGDISLCFGFNEGNRALLGLLIEAFSLHETVA